MARSENLRGQLLQVLAAVGEVMIPLRDRASADAFVYASETETMGNVVLEAMACGRAVVAPRGISTQTSGLALEPPMSSESWVFPEPGSPIRPMMVARSNASSTEPTVTVNSAIPGSPAGGRYGRPS